MNAPVPPRSNADLRPSPSPSAHPSPAADPPPGPAHGDDARLQAALRALPPPRDADALARLHARVMADWPGAAAGRRETAAEAERVGAGAAAPAGGPPVAGAWWPWPRRRASALGLGLGLGAVSVALALGLWWNRADPALDELMQPDVLSQMAAGEM